MQGIRTRGHPVAVHAIEAMIRGRTPHAVLIVGPEGIGKTTLARDLAAGLLCTAAGSARPCGSCRSCRLVASWGHPDLHRLTPEGAGRQVVIGGPGAKARGVRDMIADLALLPVEGGARVAIIEAAHRMNEDAQAALLKTLEEPPGGVTIILCADSDEPLLPTIRSRCARIRLGPVAVREIEAWMTETGVADPPTAARVARIAAGRPGLAARWAADPGALLVRDEIARTMIDLLEARPSDRLASVRGALTRASSLASVLAEDGVAAGDARRATSNAPAASAPAPGALANPATAEATDGDADVEAGEGPAARVPAAERRRAAEALVAVWVEVARDLAMHRSRAPSAARDPGLLDDASASARGLDLHSLADFLDRAGRAGVLIAGNVSPELVVEDLALAWPRPATAST